MGPALESEVPKEPDARLVVAEDAPGQGLQAELRGSPDGLREQLPPDALPAILLREVDANLGGSVIGGLLAEIFEADLPSDLPAHLRNPDWPALDGNRLGVGGHHLARHP